MSEENLQYWLQFLFEQTNIFCIIDISFRKGIQLNYELKYFRPAEDFTRRVYRRETSLLSRESLEAMAILISSLIFKRAHNVRVQSLKARKGIEEVKITHDFFGFQINARNIWSFSSCFSSPPLSSTYALSGGGDWLMHHLATTN